MAAGVALLRWGWGCGFWVIAVGRFWVLDAVAGFLASLDIFIGSASGYLGIDCGCVGPYHKAQVDQTLAGISVFRVIMWGWYGGAWIPAMAFLPGDRLCRCLHAYRPGSGMGWWFLSLFAGCFGAGEGCGRWFVPVWPLLGSWHLWADRLGWTFGPGLVFSEL